MDTTDIQHSLIGNYISNKNLFSPCENLLRPQLFTTPFTKESYKIITAYHASGREIDKNLLLIELKNKGIRPEVYSGVYSLPDTLLSSEKVIHYCQILFENYSTDYLQKQITSVNSKLSVLQEVTDPFEIMENARKVISELDVALNTVESVVHNVSKTSGTKAVFDQALDRITRLMSGEIKSLGFSWGLKSLDKKTIGIIRGISVVAATKGGGKSSLVINIIVHNVIKEQQPCLMFSVEMPAVEVMTNIIANVKRINSKALRTGNILDDDLINIKSLKERINDNFEIDETGGISWQYFEVKVKAFRQRHNIPIEETMLVMLDYLQLMKNPPEEARSSKEEKVENTCNELMRICKNENIALVLLSQFSRDGDRRASSTEWIKNEGEQLTAKLRALRPKMSDLKGSSAIEANAVTIITLYRPESYQIYEANGVNYRGLCEVGLLKARYASPEPLLLKFSGEYNLFSEHEPDDSGIISSDKESF